MASPTEKGILYVCTSVSTVAAAQVIVDQLHTVLASWGVAGPREALIQVSLAVFSNESWRARACVAANTVQTLSSIKTAGFPGAFLRGTVIHVHFTLNSYKAENNYCMCKDLIFYIIVGGIFVSLFILLQECLRVIIRILKARLIAKKAGIQHFFSTEQKSWQLTEEVICTKQMYF